MYQSYTNPILQDHVPSFIQCLPGLCGARDPVAPLAPSALNIRGTGIVYWSAPIPVMKPVYVLHNTKYVTSALINDWAPVRFSLPGGVNLASARSQDLRKDEILAPPS